MRINERLERLERRRRPKVPVVVRWDAPEPAQVDIRTGQPVDLAAKVRVIAYLGQREMWDGL